MDTECCLNQFGQQCVTQCTLPIQLVYTNTLTWLLSSDNDVYEWNKQDINLNFYLKLSTCQSQDGVCLHDLVNIQPNTMDDVTRGILIWKFSITIYNFVIYKSGTCLIGYMSCQYRWCHIQYTHFLFFFFCWLPSSSGEVSWSEVHCNLTTTPWSWSLRI